MQEAKECSECGQRFSCEDPDACPSMPANCRNVCPACRCQPAVNAAADAVSHKSQIPADCLARKARPRKGATVAPPSNVSTEGLAAKLAPAAVQPGTCRYSQSQQPGTDSREVHPLKPVPLQRAQKGDSPPDLQTAQRGGRPSEELRLLQRESDALEECVPYIRYDHSVVLVCTRNPWIHVDSPASHKC